MVNNVAYKLKGQRLKSMTLTSAVFRMFLFVFLGMFFSLSLLQIVSIHYIDKKHWNIIDIDGTKDSRKQKKTRKRR